MATTAESCQDSQLTVAASVTGILTFAYAILAGFLTYLYLIGAFVTTSTQLYRSADGNLQENAEAAMAIRHIVWLNEKLQHAAISSHDNELAHLLQSCNEAARMLQEVLDGIKVRDEGKGRKRQSVRTTLQNVQSKKVILELEKRLARLQDLLSFHVIMNVRDQVCRLKEEQSDRLGSLELAVKKMEGAFLLQRNEFQAARHE